MRKLRAAYAWLPIVLLVASGDRQIVTSAPSTQAKDSGKPTDSTPAVAVPKKTDPVDLKADTQSNQPQNETKIIAPKPITVEIP